MKEIKSGQKVYLDGKEIGEIEESLNDGRFMIKRYDSEWKIDLWLFICFHEDEMEIKEK